MQKNIYVNHFPPGQSEVVWISGFALFFLQPRHFEHTALDIDTAELIL